MLDQESRSEKPPLMQVSQPGSEPCEYVPPPGYELKPIVQQPAGPPGYPQPMYVQSGEYQPSAEQQYPPLPPGGGQYSLPPPGPVVVQRPEDMWMMIPQGVPNCPPGLEYLTMLDELIIKQKLEILEVVTGCETSNKYAIRNSMKHNIYQALEDTDFCTRNCCGSTRPFNMKIMDYADNEVIHLKRPLACQGCCCPCCLQSLDVFAPPGQFVGRVKENWSFWIPSISIENASGDTVLKIKGPCCTVSLTCKDVVYKIMTPDETTQVGKISKKWTGCVREFHTDADVFSITFPMDLDVNMKAVMLGAVFLVDFMYFEWK